ncbi:UDP-galactose transporter senju [Hyalella azteca]|uniref:UDP-galactose transporter senju n=1 Tax=Hyalella azteca TaxID=294128 RepID=A0A8B7PEW4_HYAAZ|nr:UDP-galactose transporter senju [Hyalella azteca]
MGANTPQEHGCFSKLFPTKSSFLIFSSYLALGVSLGILVTRTQDKSNGYSYNITTAVLLVELLKLTATSAFYLTRDSFAHLVEQIFHYRTALALYLVPGVLYCLSNNLTFTNLSHFDPTTYLLLMQLRVLVTGLIYQILFKRNLSRIQWISLLVLTIGCAVKQLDVQQKQQTALQQSPALLSDDKFASLKIDGNDSRFHFSKKLLSASRTENIAARQRALVPDETQGALPVGLLLVFAQIVCSCFAGVYNERLLKDYSSDMSLTLQNVLMYLDSSFCNILLLGIKGELATALSYDGLQKIVLNPSVLLVILNNVALGLVTSVFLKNLNSILKVFSSAIEPVVLAVLCFIIFGYEITLYTALSIMLVTSATYLYATNPVAVAPSPSIHHSAGSYNSVTSFAYDGVAASQKDANSLIFTDKQMVKSCV